MSHVPPTCTDHILVRSDEIFSLNFIPIRLHFQLLQTIAIFLSIIKLCSAPSEAILTKNIPNYSIDCEAAKNLTICDMRNGMICVGKKCQSVCSLARRDMQPCRCADDDENHCYLCCGAPDVECRPAHEHKIFKPNGEIWERDTCARWADFYLYFNCSMVGWEGEGVSTQHNPLSPHPRKPPHTPPIPKNPIFGSYRTRTSFSTVYCRFNPSPHFNDHNCLVS